MLTILALAFATAAAALAAGLTALAYWGLVRLVEWMS
jgi:hypothetical protein